MLTAFFSEMNNLILNSDGNTRDSDEPKRNKVGGCTLPDFKTYRKVTIIKTK